MPQNMIVQGESLAAQKARIREQMAGIVLKCWQDPAFKAALLADPKAVLQAEGIVVNPDVEYVFVADDTPKLHFIIPAPPLTPPLTHDEMLQVARAGTQLILPSIIC
ncbi:nitrile hydratase subunit alpha [Ralstonia pseudosolanacearum]|nr:nitrile hydratase subunit alpha [Ralstonia pseudosolanacearum]MDK1380470.1 nitrile hydratase subunit alpha [Ralstonia pseudosolanacearum]MDO3512434.1 nitrile hydratase subunit alpha [Ralstonia pseudosolanacearum]MDO3539365.1 nitrile hydratase subunit alpha [Ralstonia pseudosolanacearum]MDO3630801.1 nitrile hydratase subunit alpha [Ralstonia pseudosolanacearum]